MHLVGEELEAGLAAAFGHVHGDVGLPQQPRCVDSVGESLGYPDADADIERGLSDDEGGVQRVEDPLRDDNGSGPAVVFHHQDCELVAAQASNHVVAADATV